MAHGRVRCFKLLEPHSNEERTHINIITSAVLDTWGRNQECCISEHLQISPRTIKYTRLSINPNYFSNVCMSLLFENISTLSFYYFILFIIRIRLFYLKIDKNYFFDNNIASSNSVVWSVDTVLVFVSCCGIKMKD